MGFKLHNDTATQITQLNSSVGILDNNVQFLLINPATISEKGINIDDTTPPRTPVSHNPTQNIDTFPSNIFGHTGFTGTYAVAVPDYDLIVILLTNRQNVGLGDSGYYYDLGPLRSEILGKILLAAQSDFVSEQ